MSRTTRFDPDTSAVGLDNSLDEGQADADAFGRRVKLIKQLEDPVVVL